MMVEKILFILNPFAGTKGTTSIREEITRVCELYSIKHHIVQTEYKGHAIELAATASKKGYDLVVAVGGDGTINEVAQGAIKSGLAMGIIPRGSGNGLARHLGIPLTVAEGVTALIKGKQIKMDTFTINDKLSLNVSGIGFDGRIANLFAHQTKRGLWGYIKLILNEYFSFEEFENEITLGETTISEPLFVIAVANSSQYGNNARIAPLASVCDQKLHITLLKKIPLYRIDFIPEFFKGTLKNTIYSRIFEGEALQIKVIQPIPYHVDGEACGESDTFDIRIQPKSLMVRIPESSTKI
jgi:diacylglycerol kinase (ATP)